MCQSNFQHGVHYQQLQYKDIRSLDTGVGEELACQHEEGHPNGVYADAVITNAGIVVGHLPKKIPTVFFLFLC